MTDRAVHVYRLDVTIPEDRRWPWSPDEELVFSAPHGAGERYREIFESNGSWEWNWPSWHMYLSRTAAVKKADILRHFGAKVVIERSEKVIWK